MPWLFLLIFYQDFFYYWIFDWQLFATLWFLLLIPLMIPGPSSACKIITKPVPWNNQIQPWNIFNQPKPKPTQAPSSPTTSYQPPSCTCGEKVGAGAKQHPWLVWKSCCKTFCFYLCSFLGWNRACQRWWCSSAMLLGVFDRQNFSFFFLSLSGTNHYQRKFRKVLWKILFSGRKIAFFSLQILIYQLSIYQTPFSARAPCSPLTPCWRRPPACSSSHRPCSPYWWVNFHTSKFHTSGQTHTHTSGWTWALFSILVGGFPC